MNIGISSPEREIMTMKMEKLRKYPNIAAVEQYLTAACIMNQTQTKLAEKAMKLANVGWEDAQGIDQTDIRLTLG